MRAVVVAAVGPKRSVSCIGVNGARNGPAISHQYVLFDPQNYAGDASNLFFHIAKSYRIAIAAWNTGAHSTRTNANSDGYDAAMNLYRYSHVSTILRCFLRFLLMQYTVE